MIVVFAVGSAVEGKASRREGLFAGRKATEVVLSG